MAHLSIQPNERITFKVHHEDEHIVVVDKPARIVTQPGVGHEHDTLLNGLFARYGAALQKLGSRRDFGLVHRLDQETSGLLVVALSAAAYDGLRAQFEQRKVRKFYWALTHKAPKRGQGVVRLSIAEEVRKTGKYTQAKVAKISRAGKPALTAYRTIQASDFGALVEARPVTGRLHQIRVHLEAIGCTVLGDSLYASDTVRAMAPRLALHAHRLAFRHPVSEAEMDVFSPFPRDLRPTLRRMRLDLPPAKPSAQGLDEVSGDGIGAEESGVGEDPAS